MTKKYPKLQMLKPRVALLDTSRVKPLGRGPRSIQVYNTSRWRYQVQPEKLKRDPLCQRHKFLGEIVQAEHVDHWVRIEYGGDKYGDHNLVSLCAKCHGLKTALERDGKPLFEIAPSTDRTYSV